MYSPDLSRVPVRLTHRRRRRAIACGRRSMARSAAVRARRLRPLPRAGLPQSWLTITTFGADDVFDIHLITFNARQVAGPTMPSTAIFAFFWAYLVLFVVFEPK